MDLHGFMCVTPPPPVDFMDRRLVKEEYYPKLAEMVRRITGAKAGFAYQYLNRDGSIRTFPDAKVEKLALMWRVRGTDVAVKGHCAKLQMRLGDCAQPVPFNMDKEVVVDAVAWARKFATLLLNAVETRFRDAMVWDALGRLFSPRLAGTGSPL